MESCMHQDETSLQDRFALAYDPDSYRRVIAGKDVTIHCHHYNSRMQRTVESSDCVDGPSIIRSCAETVFTEQIADVLRAGDTSRVRAAAAEQLYSHLGFGTLDLSQIESGVVTASASHFVEGWLAGFGPREQPACTFTEGYIQGAVFVLTGCLVHVRERKCMAKGDPACVFHLDFNREQPSAPNTKAAIRLQPQREQKFAHSPNIDEQKIVDALVAMPLHGNAEGLIPAFGVYLANMPADYYNLVCIRFVEAMYKARRGRAAKRMLVSDGEICAMNTFRGMMASAEWESWVAPMIQASTDNMYALVAISNGLGWGGWHILEDRGEQGITYVSSNGYEAHGYREYRGVADEPKCLMLTGVAAGLMALMYSKGTIEERLGSYFSQEETCICQDDSVCTFSVSRV